MANYESMTFYERVMARQAEMAAERLMWEPAWEQIIEYFRPDITIYSSESSSETGQFLHENIIEGTGAWSAGVMARGFTGALVGPTLKWLRSQFKQQRYKGVDVLNAFLQRLDDYFLSAVFRQSNFYEIIVPNVLHGITVGSPVMLVEEDVGNDNIVCKLPHYKENYLKRDWFGNDVAYHRLFEVDALQAEQHFGKENLVPDVQEKLKSGNHKDKNKYLMVVYHKDDPIFNNLPDKDVPRPEGSQITYSPKSIREWALYYLPYDCQDKRYQGCIPYRENRRRSFTIPGFMYKPFCSWHYFRNNHETYSRTPAFSAIYDEKGGQAAWTCMYEVAEKQARSPMIAMESMRANINSSPGGYTWAQTDSQYDRPPKPLEERRIYPQFADMVDRVDDKRKRHFHLDLFRLLDEYHREHKQPPTAFEVAQMLAEKNTQIGPAIESFDRGLLGPVYDTFFEIELRSGRLLEQTDPPEELLYTDGEIMAQLVGPLAQAQKLSVMMRRVIDTLSMAGPIFELWPEARNKIKPDILIERMFEESDFYQEALASKEEYDQIIASLQMMESQRLQLENLKLFADSVPKLQKKSEQDSPMKMIGAA